VSSLWKDAATNIGAWFARCWALFLSVPNRLRTVWALRKAPELMAPAAAAMKKVYKALPKVPPDTLTGGIQNGGSALFFRHDEGIEIVIGRDYDHAADRFIQWYREEREADVEPRTKTTTQMSRSERRATSSRLRKREAPRRGIFKKIKRRKG
jgi:hypothetical protein